MKKEVLSNDLDIYKINIYVKNNFNGIHNLVLFYLRRYFTSFITLFIYILPLVILIILTSIFPIEYVFTALISSSLLMDTLLMYALSYFLLRDTTVYKMIRKDLSSTLGIYTSFFIFVLICNLMIIIYCLILLSFIYPLLEHTSLYLFPSPDGINLFTSIFKDVKWILFGYYFMIFTIVNSMVGLFFYSLSSNEKTYMFFSMSYVLLNLIYGGVISSNQDFLNPATSDPNSFGVYILDPNFVNYKNGQLTIKAYDYSHNLNFMWYLNQFLPSYHLNQLLYNSAMQANVTEEIFFLNGQVIPIGTEINLKVLSFVDWEWISILFIPFFYIAFYTTGSAILFKIKHLI